MTRLSFFLRFFSKENNHEPRFICTGCWHILLHILLRGVFLVFWLHRNPRQREGSTPVPDRRATRARAAATMNQSPPQRSPGAVGAEWQEMRDPKSGRSYWINHNTKQMSYSPPQRPPADAPGSSIGGPPLRPPPRPPPPASRLSPAGRLARQSREAPCACTALTNSVLARAALMRRRPLPRRPVASGRAAGALRENHGPEPPARERAERTDRLLRWCRVSRSRACKTWTGACVLPFPTDSPRPTQLQKLQGRTARKRRW